MIEVAKPAIAHDHSGCPASVVTDLSNKIEVVSATATADSDETSVRILELRNRMDRIEASVEENRKFFGSSMMLMLAMAAALLLTNVIVFLAG